MVRTRHFEETWNMTNSLGALNGKHILRYMTVKDRTAFFYKYPKYASLHAVESKENENSLVGKINMMIFWMSLRKMLRNNRAFDSIHNKVSNGMYLTVYVTGMPK